MQREKVCGGRGVCSERGGCCGRWFAVREVVVVREVITEGERDAAESWVVAEEVVAV